MTLQDASCEDCRSITQKIEEKCLLDMLGHARAKMNLIHKDRATRKRLADVRYRDGREETLAMDPQYLPGFMVIPHFSTAAVFLGLDWRPAPIEVLQILVNDERRVRAPEIESVSVIVNCDFGVFARMLCKTALGFAHYVLGDETFHPIVREYIRFGRGHPNHFVGGFSGLGGAPQSPENSSHFMGLWHRQGFLVATVQLFAEWTGSPVNYVVVGRLRRMPPGLPHLQLESVHNLPKVTHLEKIC
jgi:hypothetical protein